MSRPTIRLNSRGDDVKYCQERLNAIMDSKLTADGIFGPRTDVAVKSFQSLKKLVADGIVGPRTWGQLDLVSQKEECSSVTTPPPANAPGNVAVSTSNGRKGLSVLEPKTRAKVEKFLELCKERGYHVLITETLRTKAEQDALFAKGRTTAGPIVTNAQYPRSPHCWAVAVDFCRNVRGREFDDSDGFFGKVGAVAKECGLFWGGDFKSFVDKPHLENLEFMVNNSVNTLVSQYGTPENFFKTFA